VLAAQLVVLAHQLQDLGMPLYGDQPPTGYSMKASAWVSSSALLGRMNFGMRLAAGRIKGVTVAPMPMAATGESSHLHLDHISLKSGLALLYLIHSMAELCISPVGLSSVTKLSPRPLVGHDA